MSAATPSPVPWGEFSADPRQPEVAPLRASDRDRAVVLDVLAEGYADGRLAKEEHDERVERAGAAKTLGELPALIGDLVPLAPGRTGTGDLRRQAERRWESQRRQALVGMLVPSLICWVIWLVTGLSGHGAPFPWPVFVTLGTGVNLLRVQLGKQDIVEEEQRRLERKERKALERRARSLPE